jgi:hypothetical protein
MRKFLGLLVAMVVMAPIGVLAVQRAGAAADPGTDCSRASGSATFSPGFAKVAPSTGNPELNERKITISSVGTVSGCVGGGVTSGTTRATIHITDETNCNELLHVRDTPETPEEAGSNPTGVLTTTWNTHQTSTANVALLPVPGQTTQTHIHGVGSAGLFKGLTFDVTVAFTLKTGNCVNSDLTAVTYSQKTSTEIG